MSIGVNFLRLRGTPMIFFCWLTICLTFLQVKTRLIKDAEGQITQLNNETSKNFQVYRIVPQNKDELAALNQLYKMSTEYRLDFWKAPTNVGLFADVMVEPDSAELTQQFLADNNIEFHVIIEDVQKMIMQREKSSDSPFKKNFSSNPILDSFFSKRMRDDPVYTTRNKAKYEFGNYHSYNDMLKWMRDIELNYPQMAKVFQIGTTHEGRPIKGIKIGNPINDVQKRGVWIDGGMHSREWAAIHTALYFIEQLISLYEVDPQITAYVNKLNFYIVPVANPDGFEYSRSDVTPQTRFWRKNRGLQVCKKDRWRRERCCGGVDLNRNFDFHWGEIGSSEDLCSDIYQGNSAFSEPESRAIRDKIQSPELFNKLDAFITLHTYSQMWIHPYNHERKSFPNDILDLQTVGKQGVKAIENIYGTRFRFGTGADILYPSSGGSDDWAKAKANIKYVYLLELRPGEEEWDGFLLDRRQLIPTGRETWEGVKAVVDAVVRKANIEQQTNSARIFTNNNKLKFQSSMTTLIPQGIPITSANFFNTRRLFASSTSFTQHPTTPPTTFLTFQQQFITTTNLPILQALPQRREDAQVLRNSLHNRLNRLRQTQVFARREYNKNVQLAEQQRQLIFWQNQQNHLHSGCSDRSTYCANWIAASPRICRTSTVYMKQECRSSCGFCTS